MPSTCLWKEDSDGNYDTDCGCAFCLEAGTPSENGMRFCCYCGNVLFEVKYTPTEED